jgi:NADH-quinone oxidoreductase subunit N
VLLLGQAGVPFTTGFLAKFGVVGASVVTHSYVLATVAMVSAAIAAFFYLRVTVTMYSPVGAVADPVDDEDGSIDDEDGSIADEDGSIAERSSVSPVPATDGGPGTGRDGASDAVASLQILTDAPPSEWVVERGAVYVPPLTWVAIGLTVGFTVVFGIIPGPILAFAHQATLLFT